MLSGTVKWFNNEKGYGFIEYKDNEDIFVHYSAIANNEKDEINEGDIVEFELVRTDKGLQAKNVDDITTKNKLMEVKINDKVMGLNVIQETKDKLINNDSNYKTLMLTLTVLQIILPIITNNDTPKQNSTIVNCNNCQLPTYKIAGLEKVS